MRWTKVIACVTLLSGVPAIGVAQDNTQTLADIRQELSVLFVEIQHLKRELSTTGAPGGVSGGSTFERVNSIETQLQRLTAHTEVLEQRINRVVADGTVQLGDLEFRLCELEPGCDIGSLGAGSTLGGEKVSVSAPAVQPSQNPELAVGEQADFERAEAKLNDGVFGQAVDQFVAFLNDYPGSPLASKAHIRRGDALAGLNDGTGSARAYLDGFNQSRSDSDASEALFKLGRALGQLGQNNEACVTLSEVGVRYPGDAWVAQAEAERARLVCS